MVGRVVKGIGGNYTVRTKIGDILCVCRGKLHRGDIIYVGDDVDINLYNDSRGSIEKILPRKNCIIRPYIANVDVMLITISEQPKPDFTLVDKMLVNCLKEDILPLICVNKHDINSREFVDSVYRDYEGLADIVEVSAVTMYGIEELFNKIIGKFVCLSGQSAVGKSSILNSIIGEKKMEIGEMSKKIERGKHCTRHVEIFEIEYGISIADTCGFSVLEMKGFDPQELASYFTDFDDYALGCKFRGCTHINEPGCEVLKAVICGKLSSTRYNRYKALYTTIDKQWKNRYERQNFKKD